MVVQFGKLCERMGLDGVASDAKFATNPQRVENREELIARLSDCFQTRTTAEWCGVLATSGLAFGPINTIAQVFADPQVQHQNMVRAYGTGVGLYGACVGLHGTFLFGVLQTQRKFDLSARSNDLFVQLSILVG